MKNFLITTDSCCDLKKEKLEDLNVSYVKYKFNIEDNGKIETIEDEFPDDKSLLDFYERIKNGALPRTSMISEEEHYHLFKNALTVKRDIIHICLSGQLSGTYSAACSAGARISKEFGIKVFVVDSTTGCFGEAHLVENAVAMRDKGFDSKETFDFLCKEREHIHQYLIINDLMHLKRGGRLKTLQALVGSFLGIKLLITVSKNGNMILRDKIKGFKRAIISAVEKMKELGVNLMEKIIIVHTGYPEGAQFARSEILKRYPNANIIMDIMGPTIGIHLGPSSVAFQFIGTSTKPEL